LARSAAERLAALGRAHELTLTRPSNDAPLAGPKPTTLHALIKAILLPFANPRSEDRANLIGVDIPIGAGRVTALALIFHEFAINAAKYGALSVPGGRIDVECAEDQGQFHLDWKERGGPDIVQASDASGFGSLLVRATVHQLGGEIVREMRREGVHIRLAIPRDSLAEKEGP
jgi:two-component sensor histidine kinase